MNKSESIQELAGALAKAQAEMGAAKKGEQNPFFKSKYADLAAVVEAIKKPLSDHGLSYVQLTDVDEAGVYIETVLMHSSGQWMSGKLRMPVSKANDPQALGSAITYCRRYALQALVGVPAEDDDGNEASKPILKSTITSATGVKNYVDPDRQSRIANLAQSAIDAWEAGEKEEAYSAYKDAWKECSGADEQAFLKTLLASDARTFFTKRGNEEREARKAKELATQA